MQRRSSAAATCAQRKACMIPGWRRSDYCHDYHDVLFVERSALDRHDTEYYGVQNFAVTFYLLLTCTTSEYDPLYLSTLDLSGATDATSSIICPRASPSPTIQTTISAKACSCPLAAVLHRRVRSEISCPGLPVLDSSPQGLLAIHQFFDSCEHLQLPEAVSSFP